MDPSTYGPKTEIFKIETACNSLVLQRQGDLLELRNQSGALQSRLDPDRPERLVMSNLQYLVSILLFIPTPRRVLLLGTAAGSLLHFIRHHYSADIVAVDIDGELIDRFQERKILPEPDHRLSYVEEDALSFISRSEDQFDLIFFDIFSGSQSPGWILEKESLLHLHRLLGPRGAMAFNLLIDSDHDFDRFYQNLQSVCARQTLSTPVEDLENTIVFGFNGQLPERGLDWYLQNTLDLSREHGIDYLQILSSIYTSNPQGTI